MNGTKYVSKFFLVSVAPEEKKAIFFLIRILEIDSVFVYNSFSAKTTFVDFWSASFTKKMSTWKYNS